MATIFNALPGLEVPVGSVSKSLAKMWTDTAASGGAAPAAEDAKATQVNFVLHLGYQTTPEDAVKQFQTVVRFSRRYPSRIVVLCPLSKEDDTGVATMSAKIYAECHLGKSKSDKRCVEFVMLSYSQSSRRYLESQVSICLSTDLPLYYWAHRFSASSKLADYQFLLSRAKRVLLDSSIAPADAMTYPWPNPNALRDLVYSRLLPVRQTIGQFLSSYPVEKISTGLKAVTVTHCPVMQAEGNALIGWLQRRLADCDVSDLPFEKKEGAKGQLTIAFQYENQKHYFHWKGDLVTGQAQFECDFGEGETKLAASVSLLSPEMSLSEAMFF